MANNTQNATSSTTQFRLSHENLRLRTADRSQITLEPSCLDDHLPEDHQARMVWQAVTRLDLSAFYEPLRARGSDPGRPATDPRILIALWLYAATDGVGSGRELARLCEAHDAYRWICGGVSVNYHTLNDFRVGHEAALDALFTKVLAGLLHHDVVTLTRVSHDGTRIRASAGSSSFRREPTLQANLNAVEEHLRNLKKQADGDCSAQQKAAQERAARDRQGRLEAALEEVSKLEEAKAQSKDKRCQKKPVRVSSTDPEARTMRMGDGGFRPGYNAQFAVDTESNAIVGVDVINVGSDCNQATPMLQQIEQRTGRVPDEYLMDNDFVGLDSIKQAERRGTAVFAPVCKPKKDDRDQYTRKKTDSDEIAAWRQRMGTEEAKETYKMRCATVERTNAELKAHRGLSALRVRGLKKVKCVVLWSAIAYNLMHFSSVFLK